MKPVPLIVGIVNMTTDSFSDGGEFLRADAAIAHAKELLADGADIVELGAAASNPDSAHVPADVEIKRLTPVVEALKGRVSIDTAKPEVQRFALSKNIEFINDILGFPDESLYAELACSDAKLVVMHSISDSDRAIRAERSVRETLDSICRFFDGRIPALIDAGISRERIIIDPGMGFFLGSNSEASLSVLAHIADMKKRYGLPVMISVSRKSFLRNLAPLENDDLRVRTLSAELFAAMQGADYIRTHDVHALQQGLLVTEGVAHASAERFPE